MTMSAKPKMTFGGVGALIIGAGPAGLWAADTLLRKGVEQVYMLEAGSMMERRHCPKTSACNCAVCDILEGVGGAGGFSDGKKTYSLTRGTQMEQLFDPKHTHLLKQIDDTIVCWGGEGISFEPGAEAPKGIEDTRLEFGSYPLRHIGSDGVQDFISKYTRQLQSRGLKLFPEFEVKDLIVDETGRVRGAVGMSFGREVEFLARVTFVATGLQGSPWFEEQLLSRGVPLGTGPAGIGLRVEASHKALAPLFDAFYDFKLMYEHQGLHFRSFCCNQRGYIVNENHRTLGVRNVNGHSYLGEERRSQSSNFAIICKVGENFHENPQALVRRIARTVNSLPDGNGSSTIVQGAGDFCQGRVFDDLEAHPVRTNFQSVLANIPSALPTAIWDGFRGFLYELAKVIPEVATNETLIYAPEVKYYGRKVPVDFANWKCTALDGLYVIGNATGYLDSFVAAALTGIIAADDAAPAIVAQQSIKFGEE